MKQSKKSESHRIYWQQWLSSSPSSATGGAGGGAYSPQSRRELITSSAAIRISPDAARARDVTKLLRDTLNLSSFDDTSYQEKSNGTNNSSNNRHDANHDSLVLVGTLHSLPLDYIQFEHEPPPSPPVASAPNPSSLPSSQMNGKGETTSATSNNPDQQSPAYYYSSSRTSEPFHVVKTLSPSDNPLRVRDKMIEHLRRLQDHTTKNVPNLSTTASVTVPQSRSGVIAPKIQWYFVPATNEPKSPIPNCIDLDGYCTGMEDDDDEEEKEEDDGDYDEYAELGSDEVGGVDTDEPEHAANGDNSFLDSTCPDHDLLISQCPLLLLSRSSTSQTRETSQEQEPLSTPSSTHEKGKVRRQRRELRRYTQLSQCQSSNFHCVSGYLLKQSLKDPNVWRRVHCILTEDYLWYVNRVQTYPPTPSSSQSKTSQPPEPRRVLLPSNNDNKTPIFRMAKRHGRIDLVRALLLQPNTTEYSPLYRTPYSFEVVSAKGTSHVFRAPNRTLQMHWIQALSDRITQRQENSLMGHAELIVADECIARNKRMNSVAVEPLWKAFESYHDRNGRTSIKATDVPDSNSTSVAPTSPSVTISNQLNRSIISNGKDSQIMSVLRFGMEVAEYRERCRHVQAILPAKQPVVVKSEAPLTGTANDSNYSSRSGSQQFNEHQHYSGNAEREQLDPETIAMVRTTWHSAATLLSRATQVAMDVQAVTSSSAAATSKEGKRMSRSLETLCRHVDYIITGRFRRLSNNGVGFASTTATTLSEEDGKLRNSHSPVRNGIDHATAAAASTHDDPPPIDLFDLLLAELQAVASASDCR